jgi:hypothetical protein
MTHGRRTILFGMLAAGVVFTLPAEAAREFGRGNIQAVDWRVMQVAIKTPQGGVLTYKVSPNVEVKFTDGAADFPNPTYRDLAPPMYIHFQFEDQTIFLADVREVGSAPRRGAGAGSSGNESAQSQALEIRITKIANNNMAIEADVEGRNRTFALSSAQLIRGFRVGDLASATVVSRSGRQVITDLKPR